MSLGNQVLPEASVTELAAATAFAATGLPDVPVFMGPAARGPYTAQLLGANAIATLVSTYGTGPTVKECAYAMRRVAQPVVFLRLPTASAAGVLGAVTAVLNGSSTITHTISGTPTNGADVLITFTLGGTTGTGPITYTVSLDGGVTTGAPISLATGTTIAVLGVTLALGSAHAATTGDTVAWLQTVASSTVLPTTFTGTGTSVITVTGTPLDAYEVAFQVIVGGTIGAAGITYRYTLDYGADDPTWTQVTALTTATTLLLLDGPVSTESSGLTLNFAAGTLVAGDLFTFNTTGPAYDSAGLTSGTTALAAALNTTTWTWVRAVGPVTAALAGSASTIVTGWDSTLQPSWMVMDARDRAGAETLAAWSARLKTDFANYTSTRVGVAAGMERISCPINGRNNRRSSMAVCMARAMGAEGATIATDWAQFDMGPLSADVSITVDQAEVEHNANTDPSLNAMGFITLRTWPGSPGIYPTKAALLGPENDIQRVPLRRVMNVAKILEKRILQLQCVKNFRRWLHGSTPAPFVVGDVLEQDARKIERIANDLLKRGITNQGFASGISFMLTRTPISLGGGSYQLKSAMQLVALIYVDKADGTAQFVAPEDFVVT